MVRPRRWCAGREHQVAGERGLHRDLSGFQVADFADHDHVRVPTHDGSQRVGETSKSICGLTWIWLMPGIWYSTGSSTVRSFRPAC